MVAGVKLPCLAIGGTTPHQLTLDGTEQIPDYHEHSLSYASLHLEYVCLCNKSIIAFVSELANCCCVLAFEVCLDCCQAAMPEDVVIRSKNLLCDSRRFFVGNTTVCDLQDIMSAARLSTCKGYRGVLHNHVQALTD